jgi:ubiquinone/menaquinone biosynthesis C-methylase UbiE
MRRLKEQFVEKLDSVAPLAGLTVLEIGCGDGSRSVELAARTKALFGIDPNPAQILSASERQIRNAIFSAGSAEKLAAKDDFYDMVVFTLSFHHVPQEMRSQAIDEAVRVVRRDGHIVFLEPGTDGAFFEAEITFDACDGDERAAKAEAYALMQSHPSLDAVAEFEDETVLGFASTEDFIQSMNPQIRLEELLDFLRKHDYQLRAERRINIYRPRK